MAILDRSLEMKFYTGNPLTITQASLVALNVKRVIIHAVSYACTAISQGGVLAFSCKAAAGGEAVCNIGLMLNTKDGDITFGAGSVEAVVYLIKGN
jgi:hypothetical protein